MAKPLKTAIILQGGGALGAYEYGVLKELYRARGGPANFQPAVISGLSIGAINAALLAGAHNGDPIATMERIWREDFALLAPLPPPLGMFADLMPTTLQSAIGALGNQGMFHLRPEYLGMPLLAPLLTTSIYDTSPLRTTLEQAIDIGRLNDLKTQVVVTATNVETGLLMRYGNTASIHYGTCCDNTGGLTIDHILASASLPPGFPMTQIEDNYCWDGGLISNTPLSEAINGLERCGSSEEVERELIFVELFPLTAPLPRTLPEVLARVSGLMFASKIELDKKLFRKINRYVDLADDLQLLVEAISAHPELQAAVDRTMAQTGTSVNIEHIRHHPGLEELVGHKRIDAFTRIPFTADPELANGADFTTASIAARIVAGESEARRHNLGVPHYVELL